MKAKFAIYVKDVKDYTHLYSMEFNKYWNIYYDNGQDLFENEDQCIFDSTKYLTNWEIELDDYIDFMNSISLAISKGLIVGEYMNDFESIAYCKLPGKDPIHPIHIKSTKETDLMELEQFFHKYGIEN